jgi:PAS domain S-box-containing protein
MIKPRGWWRRSPWAGPLLTALYFGLGLLCVEVATVGGRAALLWLPAGVALGALLRGGTRLLPWMFCGVVAVNLWAKVEWMVLGIGVGNTLGAWIAWRLLTLHFGDHAQHVLTETRGIKWFALYGALIGPLVSGAAGATVMWATGELPSPQWLAAFGTWAFGDGCGVLIGAPLLLADANPKATLRDQRWELWVLASAFTLLTAGVWAAAEWLDLALGQGAVLCVYFPLLAWAALRLGLWVASLTVVAVAVIAIIGVQVWIPESAHALIMIEVWLYSAVMGLTTLLLAAMEQANARAHAALQGTEAKLEQALDAAQVGLWAWDIHTDEVLWSPQVYALFGVASDQPIRTFNDFISHVLPEDQPAVQATITASLQPDSLPYLMCYRVLHPDGSIRWHESRGGAVFDAAGQPTGMRGTTIDITSRKEAEAHQAAAREAQQQMERRLLEAQRLESLGVLAGGIAHDFNNLLTGIMGNASMIEADADSQPFVDDLMTATRRAADLCKQMLAYSGRGRFEVKPLDLSALTRELVQLLRATTTGRATLHLHLAPNLPPVLADSAQIQQVIMNLAINAAESLGEQGGDVSLTTSTIDLDAAHADALAHAPSQHLLYYESNPDDGEAGGAVSLPPGRYVCLEVRDSGCGMSPQTQARIFDPFFTTKFHGRGLGLAAVLGIVRGHRGALLVKSAVGQGSTFRLMLPAAPPTACVAVAPKRTRSGQVAALRQRGAALVIDDEPAVRAFVTEALSRAGFTVHDASDGDQGAALLRSLRDLRLILLDLTMPGRSTQALFSDIRAAHPTARVIIMSGFSPDEALSLLPSPPDSLLPKPFDANDLLTAAIPSTLPPAP